MNFVCFDSSIDKFFSLFLTTFGDINAVRDYHLFKNRRTHLYMANRHIGFPFCAFFALAYKLTCASSCSFSPSSYFSIINASLDGFLSGATVSVVLRLMNTLSLFRKCNKTHAARVYTIFLFQENYSNANKQTNERMTNFTPNVARATSAANELTRNDTQMIRRFDVEGKRISSCAFMCISLCHFFSDGLFVIVKTLLITKHINIFPDYKRNSDLLFDMMYIDKK